MRVDRDVARRFRLFRLYPLYRDGIHQLRKNVRFYLKSGFRALKEHHFRYILTVIYDFTNTNHRVKRPFKKSSFSLSAFSSSFYSPLCSGRRASNHFRAFLPLAKSLTITNVSRRGDKWLAIDEHAQTHHPPVAYRRSCLTRILSYCINRALCNFKKNQSEGSELVQYDNSLTHNVQIKHRDYTNV